MTLFEFLFFLLMATVTIKIANRIRNALSDFLFKLFASPEMKWAEYEVVIKRNNRAAAANEKNNTVHIITSVR